MKVKMDGIDGNICSGGDKVDARGSDRSRDRNEEVLPLLSEHADADEYAMNHIKRGKVLILNHKMFDVRLNVQSRRGTDTDRDKLRNLFSRLGFLVDVHDDLTFWDLKETIQKASRYDYSDSDCFICIVLTHGDEGMLYSYDAKYRTDEIWTPFLGNVCPSLAGKPKLFFIQACQGTGIDDGVLVRGRDSVDSQQVFKIPAHADFLIAYSTVPGYYSWRNTSEGSWFIKGVCEIFSRYHETTDVLSMMTKVNHFVAYTCISNVPNDPDMHQKKQIPCVSSMLTRKLYLRP